MGVCNILGLFFWVIDMIQLGESQFMYWGHNIPLPHPSSTLSYDTQPVMHRLRAFQHRAGVPGWTSSISEECVVQIYCSVPCPLLGIIIDRLKVFQEKQSIRKQALLSTGEADAISTWNESVCGSGQQTWRWLFLEVSTFKFNWHIQRPHQ